MLSLLKTNIGRLRIIGMLEGLSLLALLFIAVPLKYIAGYSQATQWPGTIHGVLFLLYVLNTMSVAVQQRWSFTAKTWKVLLACLIPFGTFYIDRKVLQKERPQQENPIP